MSSKDLNVLATAIMELGVRSQTDKAIEEMSELIKALLKYRRQPDHFNRDHVIEEMADVGIMLDQLRMIFGSDLSVRKRKIERLAKNLDLLKETEDKKL